MPRSVSLALTMLALAPALVAAQENVEAQRVRVRMLHRATLAADRPGIIASELPREGDTVERGKVIVRLEDEVPQRSLAVATEQARNLIPIEAAQREYDVSVTELELSEQANTRVPDAVPGIEIERLRFTKDLNKLRIDNATAENVIAGLERDRLHADLETYRITAPFSGTVVLVEKARGEAVVQGDPIVTIADPSKMKVEGFITIAEALRVRRGDEVSVVPMIPGANLPAEEIASTGRIVFVDVSVNLATRMVRVWAEVDNAKGLLFDEQDAQMTITIAPGRSIVARD